VSILDDARREQSRRKRPRKGGESAQQADPVVSNGTGAHVAGEERFTDLGNARRLVGLHGRDFRHCHPWSKDLVWTGRAWEEDRTAQLERWAKDTVKTMYALAAACPDEAERTALVKHALRTEDARRLRAMISLARSEPGIPVLPSDLDRDIWLLNCRNGTLDLRTGKLREHRREDLLTKLCPVEYHPEATCPIWERVLGEIFPATGDAAEASGSVEMIGFMQRSVGYCLTGDVSEQKLWIPWGTGANGKSLVINTILTMLGDDYATKASRDLFLSRKDDKHPTAMAQLFGKRLVACIESAEGSRLDEAMVKELTGGDPITARRMREDYWTFAPTHKAFLVTNHRPRVRGTDHAIWRRLCLVPFTVVFAPDRQDKQLPDKLRAELPGILAWAVRGCLDWTRNGLGVPGEVRIATADYRSEQDLIGSFIAECCVTGDPTYRSRASALYARFKAWCEAGGDRDVPRQQDFGAALTERGFERYSSNGTWYRKIALRPDAPEEGDFGP
jgi:putative DNA primase/helicase